MPLSPVTSPVILGIMNTTPDSFSDGGDLASLSAQLARAESLVRDGATVLDIGGESTRPGSKSIDIEEEWGRIAPAIAGITKEFPYYQLSVDTRKIAIAERAAESGVTWLNLLGVIPNKAQAETLKRRGYKRIIVMHMHGTPETMQQAPLRRDQVCGAVSNFFADCEKNLLHAGFEQHEIFYDPGIGFGKTDAANLMLLAHTSAWSKTRAIAIGISRKSLIGRAFDIATPKDRDDVSNAFEFSQVLQGAALIRTHAPRKLKKLLDTFKEEQAC